MEGGEKRFGRLSELLRRFRDRPSTVDSAQKALVRGQHIDGLLDEQAIYWGRIVRGEIAISTWHDKRKRHAQMVGRELTFCGLDLAGMREGAALLPDEIRFAGTELCQACRSQLEGLAARMATGDARGRGVAAGEGE
jgi:hypothetical protein